MHPMTRRDYVRRQAISNLQEFEVLMLDGHFDYGNGYHGRLYLNPHRIFRQPSLIWRFAQDLIEILPDTIVAATDVVAGPVMGGALLAHTVAGLLDARRSLHHPPTSFAPLSLDASGSLVLRPFYRTVVSGKQVLLADDVRNTGKTFEQAKGLIEEAGGSVIGTMEIYDRLEAIVDLGVPNFALAEYRAPENYGVADCPMCQNGQPVTAF
jgi:orotate phosphoribosyltransferase